MIKKHFLFKAKGINGTKNNEYYYTIIVRQIASIDCVHIYTGVVCVCVR